MKFNHGITGARLGAAIENWGDGRLRLELLRLPCVRCVINVVCWLLRSILGAILATIVLYFGGLNLFFLLFRLIQVGQLIRIAIKVEELSDTVGLA